MCAFDEYGARRQFDAFCKIVLRHEAINYFRELNGQQKWTVQFSALSRHEMDELWALDEYPSDKFAFWAFDHVLHIQSESVADAFADLPEREQQILILHCVLELSDGAVGDFVGMSRSAVQRHRTKTLKELRRTLTSKEGGSSYKTACF